MTAARRPTDAMHKRGNRASADLEYCKAKIRSLLLCRSSHKSLNANAASKKSMYKAEADFLLVFNSLSSL